MNLAYHLPILQILFPLVSAVLCVVSFNLRASYIIATAAILISSLLSIYFYKIEGFQEITYVVGNWPVIGGIEYRLDHLSQNSVILVNMILLFFLVFGQKLTHKLMLEYVEDKQQHIFYALLLFAHAGYIGVISTNDLFNLYVFIEISSLSTYVLMSIAKNRSALIGAFDYLILGTIGATLILIGIGFLLAHTGSLNMGEVARILDSSGYSNTVYGAVAFVIVGILLKISFFPMHFWMRRAYNNSSPIILTYLAAISSIFSIYIISRFTQNVFDITEFQKPVLFSVIRPVALFAIIIGSFLAFRSINMKEVVVYSTTAQIGYILLVFTMQKSFALLWYLLIIDAVNKISLFTMISHIQSRVDNLNFNKFINIHHSPLFKSLVAITLISSAGLPPLAMFFVKIKILELLLDMSLYFDFTIVIFGSVLAILYNFKIAKTIFSSANHHDHHITIDRGLGGFAVIVSTQVGLLFCMSSMLTNFVN